MNGAGFVATIAPVIFGVFAILVAKLVRWNDEAHHIREVQIMGKTLSVTNSGLALTLVGIAAVVSYVALRL